MGRRGPKPKVAAPPTRPGRPLPPTDLTPKELCAWDQLVGELDAAGRLLATDRGIVELYARTYALHMRIAAELAADTLTSTSDNGRAYINPLIGALLGTEQRLHRILLDCGLSPATRKGDAPPSADPRASIREGDI